MILISNFKGLNSINFKLFPARRRIKTTTVRSGSYTLVMTENGDAMLFTRPPAYTNKVAVMAEEFSSLTSEDLLYCIEKQGYLSKDEKGEFLRRNTRLNQMRNLSWFFRHTLNETVKHVGGDEAMFIRVARRALKQAKITEAEFTGWLEHELSYLYGGQG